jgi:hypothetical protein
MDFKRVRDLSMRKSIAKSLVRTRSIHFQMETSTHSYADELAELSDAGFLQ